MRRAKIFYKNLFAGILCEDEIGYIFSYEEKYLNLSEAKPISLTLPLQREAYTSEILFPFFDGLIPEGWTLNIAIKNCKLNYIDRFGLLLSLCGDCIGSISVFPY